MRVRGFSLARLRDDDQGAVLAIVAISLLVLLGMPVLTFDLGHARTYGGPCRSEPGQRLPDSSADRLNLRRPAAEKT